MHPRRRPSPRPVAFRSAVDRRRRRCRRGVSISPSISPVLFVLLWGAFVTLVFRGDAPVTATTSRSLFSFSRAAALATPVPPQPPSTSVGADEVVSDRATTETMTTTATARNTLRWLARGIVPELFRNAALRPAAAAFDMAVRSRRRRDVGWRDRGRTRERARRRHTGKLAVVTGATGGIGAEAARLLALEHGYDVLLAARDIRRGEALAEEIRRSLLERRSMDEEEGREDRGEGGDGKEGRTATRLPEVAFVEYHADIPESARDVASAVERFLAAGSGERRRISLLVNNAGVMGESVSLTMKVNVLGPAILTLALLPAMAGDANNDNDDGERSRQCDAENNAEAPSPSPLVINVGSSSHLRASSSATAADATDGKADGDLSAYARSKLALMQFSSLLRASGAGPRIADAHPGLVWTPLLRNRVSGGVASALLDGLGLARWIYKSPGEGARAILGALSWNEGCGEGEENEDRRQAYYVDGAPGGYAAPESRDADASTRLWRDVIEETARAVAPEGCRMTAEGLAK